MVVSTLRDCVRCSAKTKSKKRCTRRTCVTAGKCWQHTAAEDGLRVKPSTIPGAGKGLFAERDFAPNRKIADYGRKSKFMPGPIDPTLTDDRYPYAWCPTMRRC